jgi:hypothetical protein
MSHVCVSVLTYIRHESLDTSRPALEPARFHIRLVTAALSSGLKWTRRGGYIYLMQRLMRGGNPPPRIHLHGVLPNQAEENIYTFDI